MSRQINYIIGFVFLSFAGYYFLDSNIGFAKQNQSDTFRQQKIIQIDTTDSSIAAGQKIFQAKCASCHTIFKDKTGPALAGVSDRWADKKELFDFIKTPSLVIARNEYAKKLKEKYRLPHPAYTLSDEEIQNVLDYIKSEEKKE